MNALDLERLDVMRLAQMGHSLQGQWPSADLPRWAQSNFKPDVPLGEVSWQLAFELRRDQAAQSQAWLSLTARADINLQCQRCLQGMTQSVEVSRRFRFVANDALAAQQDVDAEEDVLSLEQVLSARELIEDELIMALPMVPMHPVCPETVNLSVQTNDFVEKANPFSALANLNNRRQD